MNKNLGVPGEQMTMNLANTHGGILVVNYSERENCAEVKTMLVLVD